MRPIRLHCVGVWGFSWTPLFIHAHLTIFIPSSDLRRIFWSVTVASSVGVCVSVYETRRVVGYELECQFLCFRIVLST